LITSFDVWASTLPPIEVYGTRGSLHAPDPNRFGGVVSVRRAGVKEWSELPLTHHYDENSRGIGLAEMAYAMRARRPQRASGALTYHVLDVMHAIEEASEAGRHIEIASTCERPRALPLGLLPEETLQG
jgi:predicted dehydrogenase